MGPLMASTGLSRRAYFETGLDVLAERGYAGLKLAEVCTRLGVTSGSFYHYFDNWAAYTHELVGYWKNASTKNLAECCTRSRDPRRRIDLLIHNGLNLPHGAEAAIRTWSALDPRVRAAQEAVDSERHEIMRQAALQILRDERQAHVFADWSVYLLIGYEQCSLPKKKASLEWIASQMLECLDSGRFATISGRI